MSKSFSIIPYQKFNNFLASWDNTEFSSSQMQCEWQRKNENSLLCFQVPELICINICSFGQCKNYLPTTRLGLPQWFRGKESACIAGDMDSILEPGRSPGGGNGNPLQNSCLGNPTDRGDWQAAVHGVTKSWTRLSD